MEVKVMTTNMYCNNTFAATTGTVENIFSNGREEEEYEEDIPMYEEKENEDAFSDIDYDSDDCAARLNKRRYDDEDSEDEIWEDEEEDEEISNAIRLKLLREKSKKQLEGLTVLDGKLNWLEKVPVTESDIDNDDYPVLGAIVKPAPGKTSAQHSCNRHESPPNFVPATYIKVSVGNRTFIEFQSVICKAIKEGKPCMYGDRCSYSHDVVAPKIEYPNRLCNFIRNGERCRFAKCKFSHDLVAFKNRTRAPTGDNGDNKNEKRSKPMCRNGLNCENRKCTFVHPAGSKKSSERKQQPDGFTVMTPRTTHKSPSQIVRRTPNSSPRAAPLDLVDMKFLLCKNVFEVKNGSINKIGTCKFGEGCRYAHDWTEVRDKINNNLADFKCSFQERHGNCKGICIEFIEKKNDAGKVLKTRRYKNAPRRCGKIHEKERVKDFIIRTQA